MEERGGEVRDEMFTNPSLPPSQNRYGGRAGSLSLSCLWGERDED